MTRINWHRDAGTGEQRSACGRFTLRPVCLAQKWWGYWGLTDAATGREYPCRTEASAKAAARNLLREGGAA